MHHTIIINIVASKKSLREGSVCFHACSYETDTIFPVTELSGGEFPQIGWNRAIALSDTKQKRTTEETDQMILLKVNIEVTSHLYWYLNSEDCALSAQAANSIPAKHLWDATRRCIETCSLVTPS
jgi:hypothetical protein